MTKSFFSYWRVLLISRLIVSLEIEVASHESALAADTHDSDLAADTVSQTISEKV